MHNDVNTWRKRGRSGGDHRWPRFFFYMRACGMRNSVVWNFLPPVVRRGQAPNVPLPLVSGAASSTRWRSESGWLSNNLQAYNWTEAISWAM